MRKIVKVFPETGGAEAWRSRVLCDDGTTWEQDTSKYHSWRCIDKAPIPPQEPTPRPTPEPSLFERVFGKSHGGY